MRKFLSFAFKESMIYLCTLFVVFIYNTGFAQPAALPDINRITTADSLESALAAITAGKLPRMVPILYGEQSRDRLVQSVSYLNGRKLESAPVGLLSNAFAGRLSGLCAEEISGAPRYSNPDLRLRGRNPLIVIDGVPRYNLVDQDNGLTL